MAQQLTRNQKVQRGVWAIAFAACIFAGATTGAQLKTDKEKETAITEFRSTPPAEQIAMLEKRKDEIRQQMDVQQRKLDVFKETAKKRSEEAEKKAKGS